MGTEVRMHEGVEILSFGILDGVRRRHRIYPW